MNHLANRRILVVDDMPSIHEDFRKILAPADRTQPLDDLEFALFGSPAPVSAPVFELDSAFQGHEALAKLLAARDAGRPYALAFVDMRMPPGWDGVDTIEHLWQVDPWLKIVICTAYSDHSWDEVAQRLDRQDQLVILRKPFEPAAVTQLATDLTGGETQRV